MPLCYNTEVVPCAIWLQDSLFSGQSDLHAILGEKKDDDLYVVLGDLATLSKTENSKVALKARQVSHPIHAHE